MYAASGTFACRTLGCNRRFAGFAMRNRHEARCTDVCAVCGVSFSDSWLLENHLHEHETGLAYRCQLGCGASLDPADTGGIVTSIDNWLWFPSQYAMHKHHLVNHGVSYTAARSSFQAPRGYARELPVPLVSEEERQFNLGIWREEFAARRRNETEAQAEARRENRRIYKANEKLLESDEQRRQRLARIAEIDARIYARIKADVEQYAHRLELARRADRARRAVEPADKRAARLKKKAAGARRRLAALPEAEREERNAKRRPRKDETFEERERRLAPRRVKADETPEEVTARKAKRNACRARMTLAQREREDEMASERNRRYKAKNALQG